MSDIKQQVWAIPDIHAEYDLLEKLLKELHEKHDLNLDRDKLIFLGDMVDRGPKSKEVVEKIQSLIDYMPPGNCIALGGNHEYLAINSSLRKPHAEDTWYANGGIATERSFKPDMPLNGTLPDDVVKWLASLPLYHIEEVEGQKYFFSHAPVPHNDYRKVHLKDQGYSHHELTWTYTYPPFVGHMSKDFIGVCGHIHAVTEEIWEPRLYLDDYNKRLGSRYIYLDSGCGCADEAPLIAMRMNDYKVVRVFTEGFGSFV